MCCVFFTVQFYSFQICLIIFLIKRAVRKELWWIKSVLKSLTDLSLSYTMSVTTWFEGDASFTHLRKRLSSSSRWCLSFALRLHSSCSDFMMSLFLSKRLIEAKINLDRNRSKARNNDSLFILIIIHSDIKACYFSPYSLHFVVI